MFMSKLVCLLYSTKTFSTKYRQDLRRVVLIFLQELGWKMCREVDDRLNLSKDWPDLYTPKDWGICLESILGHGWIVLI